MSVTIERVSSAAPRQDQIDDLNSMILAINGKVSQAKYDKNELDTLYNTLGLSRKFLRNQSIGNTLATYTGFSHLIAESGYSVWKYTPTSYSYNSLNAMYLDDIVLTNRGEADSESATSFDSVQLYNGDSGSGYTDNTTEAATSGGTEFSVMDSANDYLYLGEASTFSGIKFEWQTRGSNYTLVVQYYSGASGDGWDTLTANDNDFDDDTSNFQSDGKISWTTPDDWATVAVNGTTKYWIRISTSTEPVTTAKAYYVIPGDSVIGLLALSSTQVTEEEWAWCTYGSSIYVTIRNSGGTSYEGNYYITSTSSATNLQNYFIHNHTFSLDHLSSLYDPVKTKTANYTILSTDGIICIDATDDNVMVTLPDCTSIEGKQYTIKCTGTASGYQAQCDCYGSQTIDGSLMYTFSSDNEAITIVSDASNWLIIGKV